MKPGYVDVRGPWPVLVIGQLAVELTGCENRGISVDNAMEVAKLNGLL